MADSTQPPAPDGLEEYIGPYGEKRYRSEVPKPADDYNPNQPRINTPCPVCHGRTLFIGAGGLLTCSRIDCPNPDTGAAIAASLPKTAVLAAEVASLLHFRQMYDDMEVRHVTDFEGKPIATWSGYKFIRNPLSDRIEAITGVRSTAEVKRWLADHGHTGKLTTDPPLTSDNQVKDKE